MPKPRKPRPLSYRQDNIRNSVNRAAVFQLAMRLLNTGTAPDELSALRMAREQLAKIHTPQGT